MCSTVYLTGPYIHFFGKIRPLFAGMTSVAVTPNVKVAAVLSSNFYRYESRQKFMAFDQSFSATPRKKFRA